MDDMWTKAVDGLSGLVTAGLGTDLLIGLAGGVALAAAMALAQRSRGARQLAGGRQRLRLGASELVLYAAVALWLVFVTVAFNYYTDPDVQQRDGHIVRWLVIGPAVLAACFLLFVSLPRVSWDDVAVERDGPFERHKKIRWSDVQDVAVTRDATKLRGRDGTMLSFVSLRGGGADLTARALAALRQNQQATETEAPATPPR